MATKPQIEVVAEVSVAEVGKPFDESLKLAGYGATGGRKTLQIGHLIDAFGVENVGIISCEHGLSTIRGKIDERFVKVVDSRADLRSAYAWAKEQFTKPEQWVCVDGGTRALNWIQQEIFGGAQAALEAMINGSARQALDGSIRPYAAYISKDLDMNSQQMWWKTGQETERLFDGFIKLGTNMYWTFWEKQTSISQYVKGMPWKPDAPGTGAGEALKRAFDYVFRLVSEGEQVNAYFRNPPNSNVITGKVRDDWDDGIKVPDSITNFNLADFVRLVRPTTNDKEKRSE